MIKKLININIKSNYLDRKIKTKFKILVFESKKGITLKD